MIEEASPTKIVKGVEPLISVVLPVYNGEAYLAEAIESILAQSFANFELIMIDDGSTDGSQKILREFELRDERVRVIVRENRGLATTLNDSIDVARGEWIARMDQDDIALPNRFERQLLWLEQTGADICGSWVRFFGSDGQRVWKCYQTDQAVKMDMLFRSPFAHPSIMMRTVFLKQFCYRKEFDKAEDFDLWVRCAQAGLQMTNVPEVLLLYRIHSSQTSVISSNRQRELTAEMQKSYWASTMKILDMAYDGQEVITLTRLQSKPDMDVVDVTLAALLKQNKGEAASAIMNNITWLYLRVAADFPDIVSRWKKLHQQSGFGRDYGTVIKLYLLRFFNARRGGVLFNTIKRVYYFFIR